MFFILFVQIYLFQQSQPLSPALFDLLSVVLSMDKTRLLFTVCLLRLRLRYE